MPDTSLGYTNSDHNYPQSNGLPMSALLTDPTFRKQHPSDGITSFPSHFQEAVMEPRQNSEPLPASVHHSFFDYDIPTISSKDDAHFVIQGQNRGPSKASKLRSTAATQSGFDARQLLDPKSYNPGRRPKDKNIHMLKSGPSVLPSTNGTLKRNTDDMEIQGMGNMIERIHGVSQRDERPSKKPKSSKSDDEDEKKTTFMGGSKGGDIGEFMREKRKEAQANTIPSGDVVDLTAGDDDDVVVIPPEDKTVCYGRLDKTKVQAHMVPNPSLKATFFGKAWWPPMTIALKRLPGKDNIIRVEDPTGKDFGNIDVRTAIGLARILDFKKLKIRAQARLLGRTKTPVEYPGQPCSSYLDATINLYGPKSQVKAIGTWLGQRQIFLRDPNDYDRSFELCNPHAPKPGPALPRTSGPTQCRDAGYAYRTVEETRNEVMSMFDSLQKSESMPELDADEKITTELLTHQKQGLHFMTQREQERIFSDKEEDNNSLWRQRIKPTGVRVYYHVITGREERQKPPEVLGGILADMMGLGKTLSILALVTGSAEKSLEWAKLSPDQPEEDQQFSPVRNTKSTLLIAPLSTLNNWEEQIGAHVKEGALSYYLYHGNNRSTDLEELSKYDMIITTYSIVGSEFKGRGKKRILSPLYQLNFFRIVLDEAHMIREQGTLQSQATCQLSAQRRWAVTGTPVQNRLDDLGALIKFLRIKPFDKTGFTQFILAPFKNADPEILPKLRLLVDSITLRRLKDRIDLPPRHDLIIRLQFSQEEAELYDWFMKYAHQKVKTLTGGEKQSLGGRSYVHILQAIMRLRLICAHGRELLTEDDLKMTEGFTAKNAITLDDEEEEDDKPTVMHPRIVNEMMLLARETDQDKCISCAKKIDSSDDDDTPPKDGILGYMLPCFQMVCRDCMKIVQPMIDEKVVNDRFPCPFCAQWLKGSPYQITQTQMDEAEEERERARENPRHSKIMSRYRGPHTKTRALVKALLESQAESKNLPAGEPPIKSVVFSGWTSHLDLIQIALDDVKLTYVRLDGKMSRQKRNASLDAFRDDNETTIILISLTAGGLGLNLTTGSKVYVMEPQFNPAAEAQAVDRVHRLGQKREVTTTRYIMENSFEENMLKLQRKKQNLADLSMNRGKLDKAEAAKQRMEELRSLFR